MGEAGRPGVPGAVVLAAGGSTRLGRPKQLLVLGGEPLVRRAARAALEAGLSPVVVVVGAAADGVRAAIAGLPVAAVENAGWAEGIGSSIRAGIAALARAGAPAAAVVLCDQPRLDAAHLARLAATWRAGAAIAASAYGGARGVPAVFDASVFGELASLAGDRGARAVISRDPARVAEVPFPGGEEDVDRPEDWERVTGPYSRRR
ncbi:MAG TPA: nucleotidyltransferase family protein [Anaeromyxobacteraceae bacterium]|nr:nucleotidyltransferase family protein [Anaeromyxobacteraceae bacterium]